MNEMKKFWGNKTVLISGHTGFKGSWLSLWLMQMGSKVYGVSLEESVSNPNLYSLIANKELNDFRANINDSKKIEEIVINASPDIIFHLAAQPIVRDSYLNPAETYKTNVIGTVNLLDAARKSINTQSVVIVTSDKCYLNTENEIPFEENDPLGGFDPYSSSKACAEHVALAYYHSFFKKDEVGIATARAGNIIGGGDWAKDRIVPDAIRSWINGNDLMIRSPHSIRPWQNVLEPIFGYLLLAEKLFDNHEKFSSSWNFGPDQENFITVESLIKKALRVWKNKTYVVNEDNHYYESKHLTLNSNKSKKYLKWKPIIGIEKTIQLTFEWYKNYYNDKSSAIGNSIDMIDQYLELYRKQNKV
tara:strand:- start:2745 stop:3824 length:1080 start_codon:yes stop_codon:yes gene_type:complete